MKTLSKPTNTTIDIALKEDAGKGDITTDILIPSKSISEAFFITREKAVICGLQVVESVFRKLDPRIKIRFLCKDGDSVGAHKKIIRIKGKTRALLTGERVALNFLSHLSGVATTTRRYVDKIRPCRTKIMDTRKTTPGLRILEKTAVRYGGGVNHRVTLSDSILIKDNHHAACQHISTITDMVKRCRRTSRKAICVEVENLQQLREGLRARPDIILLDNMHIGQIKKAVALTRASRQKHKPLLEVSGKVGFHNVRKIAKTGVDRISIGALTHTAQTIDISMEFIPPNARK